MSITIDFNTVWLIDLATKKRTFFSSGEAAAWSLDGARMLIYVGVISRSGKARELQLLDNLGRLVETIPISLEDNESARLSASSSPILATPPTSPATPLEYVSGLSWVAGEDLVIFSLSTYTGPDTHRAFIASLSTGEVRRFRPDEQITFVAWSPDGHKIAYIRQVGPGREGELVISDQNGRCLIEPALPPEVGGITWAPDGNRIAFLYEGAIYVLDLSYSPLDETAEPAC